MIDPISAKVLSWHYAEGYSFQEITGLLQRSISTVRNYHNRGMFELQQYYLRQCSGREPITLTGSDSAQSPEQSAGY